MADVPVLYRTFIPEMSTMSPRDFVECRLVDQARSRPALCHVIVTKGNPWIWLAALVNPHNLYLLNSILSCQNAIWTYLSRADT